MSSIDSGAWNGQLGAKVMRLRASEPNNRVYVTVLGANGSGKSAFIVRFLTQRFIGEYSEKLEGVYTKQETVDGYQFDVTIKDTVDQDNLSIACICRWSHIAIVLYGIDDHSSYQRACIILEQLSRHDQAREVTLALVGNKTDLIDRRRVTSDEAHQVAREEDSQFAELSVADEHGEPGRLMRRLLSQHVSNCLAHQRELLQLLGGLGSNNDGDGSGSGSSGAGHKASRSRGSSPSAQSLCGGGSAGRHKKSMELLRCTEVPVPVKKNSTPFKALKERFAWK